jgi:hypothetical protein
MLRESLTRARLIVRPHEPLRLWAQRVLLVLLLLLVPWLAFELGRYRAGYDSMAVNGRESALRELIRQREAALEDRQEQIAQLEAAALGQGQERSEVARTIGELQAKVARLEQDVAFYRGLATNEGAANVMVQRIKLVHQGGRRYVATVHLGRPSATTGNATGSVDLRVEGTQGGLPISLDVARLAAGAAPPAKYGFRYLQEINYPLQLPPGFEPQRLLIQLQPAQKDALPVRQVYGWSPQPAQGGS